MTSLAATPARPAAPLSTLSNRVVALLAVAMFLNYADRGSLSIVAPLLKDRLAIGDVQMGVLLSGFFWAYAPAQPFAGWLVQRADVRLVLAGGLAVWAGATMLSAFAGGFAMLFGLRLLLGLGESVIFPANACLLARHAPEHLRGRANAVISVGLSIGPSAGVLAGGLILAHWGWRAVFLSLGLVSLLWLIPWLATPVEPTDCGASRRGPSPSYAELLRLPALWGASIGMFCYSFPLYLLLTWLPLFLVKQQHRSLTEMAWIGMAIYAAQALAALASGALSDRLIHAGRSPTWVRKGCLLTGLAGAGLAMLLASYTSGGTALACLCACAMFTGISCPMVFAIAQTLSGPNAGGRWMGIQNMVGNLSGIAAPTIAGLTMAATGSLAEVFRLSAVLAVLGMVCWGLVIGRIAPTAWREAAQPEAA